MRRYLIVDDNVALAENLAEILRDEGADVEVATNGADALALVRTTKFSALVTDMRMPVMSGAELLKALRVLDAGLPVLVMTAYTGERDLADARETGVLVVLPKPVPIPSLLRLTSNARRSGLVAIVEDDLELCDALSEMLRVRGFTAVSASTAIEAERFGNIEPFVAVVDLNIPGAPFGEVMCQMSARFPHLPILVMTGVPEGVPDVPHDAVFAKPVDLAVISESVERIYERGAR